MAKQPQMGWLQTNTVRVARLHFVFVFLLAALTIAYDGWNLITSQALMERWTVAVIALLVTTGVWFIARNTKPSQQTYYSLLGTLIAMDITIASFAVYQGRGMASRAVALFALPLIISSITLKRSAIFATAAACTAAYSYAAVQYFTDYPSEGYKVELYGDLFFYSAGFFIIAAALWTIVRSVQPRSK